MQGRGAREAVGEPEHGGLVGGEEGGDGRDGRDGKESEMGKIRIQAMPPGR